jgi:cytochrome d ubiquinol oxidase subunit II
MLDFETLRVIWWLLLGTLLIGFAIMDGFDLGVAAIVRLAGKTDEERRVLLASIEPVWDGNQVWFILAGGAVFAAWPVLYAASFSGLYLAMFLLLVALILRPVGFTYRNKLADARWRGLWDWALFLGGAVPALLFGVAIGNLFLGLPFHFDELQRPVYTGSFLGLLHPYALLTGLVSLFMLVMHGCAHAVLKCGEPMSTRAASVGRTAAVAFCISFIVAGCWVCLVMGGHHVVSAVPQIGTTIQQVAVGQGAWLANYEAHGILWIFPVTALLSALWTLVLLGSARFRSAGFVTSCLTQAATILTAGSALFPFLMPSSTHPSEGLTIWNASSSQKTLQIMLIAVIIFLPIVLAYTTWVFRILRGRVTLEEIRRHSGLY